MARRRKGRKDAIIALLFPISPLVIPDFCPLIPAFFARHSRESGNPEGWERRLSATPSP